MGGGSSVRNKANKGPEEGLGVIAGRVASNNIENGGDLPI